MPYYKCDRCNCTVTPKDLREQLKAYTIRVKGKIYTQPSTKAPVNTTKGKHERGFIFPEKAKAIDGNPTSI